MPLSSAAPSASSRTSLERSESRHEPPFGGRDGPGRVLSHARALFAENLDDIARRTDRLFAVLILCEWLAVILVALIVSPRTWAGASSWVHIHVWAALGLGGAIASLPVVLALIRPGRIGTRHVIAAGQMLMGALLIHLAGGRIETHFHIFGSLAFLAFYRDWRVLVTASVVVIVDHLMRGFFWPRSSSASRSSSPGGGSSTRVGSSLRTSSSSDSAWRARASCGGPPNERPSWSRSGPRRHCARPRSGSGRRSPRPPSEWSWSLPTGDRPGQPGLLRDPRLHRARAAVALVPGIHAPRRPREQPATPRAIAGGRGPHHVNEKRYLARSGAIVWVQSSVSLVRDGQGRPLHFIWRSRTSACGSGPRRNCAAPRRPPRRPAGPRASSSPT